jgi:hypothetical protein
MFAAFICWVLGVYLLLMLVSTAKCATSILLKGPQDHLKLWSLTLHSALSFCLRKLACTGTRLHYLTGKRTAWRLLSTGTIVCIKSDINLHLNPWINPCLKPDADIVWLLSFGIKSNDLRVLKPGRRLKAGDLTWHHDWFETSYQGCIKIGIKMGFKAMFQDCIKLGIKTGMTPDIKTLTKLVSRLVWSQRSKL